MKKYKFNLESVLKVRKIKEDNEKKVFGCLVKDLSKAKIDLTAIKNQIVSAYETQECDLEKDGSLDFVRAAGDFIKVSENRKKEQNKVVRHREERVSLQREILLDAVTKRKIIEKYKEKRKQEHAKLQRQTETKFIDESSARRFGSKKKSG